MYDFFFCIYYSYMKFLQVFFIQYLKNTLWFFLRGNYCFRDAPPCLLVVNYRNFCFSIKVNIHSMFYINIPHFTEPFFIFFLPLDKSGERKRDHNFITSTQYLAHTYSVGCKIYSQSREKNVYDILLTQSSKARSSQLF